MKLDLSTSTDSVKQKATLGNSTPSTNPSENVSQGFMSQFSALLAGESAPKDSTNSAQTPLIKTEQALTQNLSAQSQVAEELLEGGDNPDSDTISNKAVVDIDGKVIVVDKEAQKKIEGNVGESDLASDIKATEALPARKGDNPTQLDTPEHNANLAVSESDELLGRLNKSNKALQPADLDIALVENAEHAPVGQVSNTEISRIEDVVNEVYRSQIQNPSATSGKELPSVDEALLNSTLLDKTSKSSQRDEFSASNDSAEQSVVANRVEAAVHPDYDPVVDDRATIAEDEQFEGSESKDTRDIDANETAAIQWGQSATGETKSGDMTESKSTVEGSSVIRSTGALTSTQIAQAQTANQSISTIDAKPSVVDNTPLTTSSGALVDPALSSGVKSESLQASLAATGMLVAKNKQDSSVVNSAEPALQGTNPSAALTATSQPVRAEVNTAQGSVVISQAMTADQMAEKAHERVQVMLSKNLKNIDIRLDPPELGRMQIRMNMNGDATTVHFTVANAQARDVVEQAMPRLREMLAQQGVQLADTSVQQQSSGQQQGFTQQGQSGAGGAAHRDDWSGEDEGLGESSVNLNVKTEQDGISFYA
ncbi:flagellar hook-length control protein FliK [Vibrio sp. FNV 38]|nr:flagellar hook-length control protein FliK [Vibrio sp. FNV 38]